MEVHHHSHHSHKKTWKSYFWEFLMLFLAVFCGFLAEYRLEHVIEHQREEKLMHTLAEELQDDVTTLTKYYNWRQETHAQFDTLLILLARPDPEEQAERVYDLIQGSTFRFGLPDINSGTITQLTNAGGLRLVRSDGVSKSINKHYMNYNRMRSTFETERMVRLALAETRAEVIDARLLVTGHDTTLPYKFISKEPVHINRFVNSLLAARQLNMMLIRQLDSVRVSSEALRQLIESEYED
jgi:hypothetical protein